MNFLGDPRFIPVLSQKGEKMLLRVDTIASIREHDKGGSVVTCLPNASYAGEFKVQNTIEELSTLISEAKEA